MKAWILPVIWTAFCLGILEAVSSAWISRSGDALDKTRSIITVDRELGWRQIPGLRTTFHDHALRTNELGFRGPSPKTDSIHRILVLGPSSAFGWGIAEEKTYSALLEKRLKTEVVNGGEIGFSTHQGLKLLKTPAVAALRPSAILLAYGVNDVDRHRFYFQNPLDDAAALKGSISDTQLFALGLLAKSSLLDVLYKFANRLRAWGPSSPNEAPVPPLRVGENAFTENLRELIRHGRQLGARVALIGTAVHLPSAGGEDIASLENEGRKFFGDGRFEESVSVLNEAVRRNPSANESYYVLSAALRALGRDRESADALAKARANEPFRIRRDITAYNSILRRIAGEEKVPLADLERAFAGRDQESLFVDPIHPSARGHEVIADEIGSTVFPEAR